MKMLFINAFGQNATKNSDILPRIGDMVDMFYRSPFSVVSQVLLWPSAETLESVGYSGDPIDAIITVK